MLNSSIRIDEEILKTTKRTRISQVINTEQIQKNIQNIHKNAIEDIQQLIKERGQGLSVYFNQKISLAYLQDKNYISVFSFNEDANQRLYEKVVPDLHGKLIRNAPIFYKTQQSLILVIFTKTQVYIKSLFDQKNNLSSKLKLTDKTEEILQAVLTRQDEKFCYVKILDSNFVLKDVQISPKGTITVSKSLSQFQNKQRSIIQGLTSLFISGAKNNQENIIKQVKLLYARKDDQKLSAVIQNSKIKAFFEGSKKYHFQFEEQDIIEFIKQHESDYLDKNFLNLDEIEFCEIILVTFDQIKPLFACVYTLRCRNKNDLRQFASCKLALFYYQPSQLSMSQHLVLSEAHYDRTYITDYQLMTQYNFDNNNDPLVRSYSKNNKIFVILKYFSLHENVKESNLFEIDIQNNKVVHKLINEDVYGGGVVLGVNSQQNYNFFVINTNNVLFFDDCNGLKLKQLQSRQSLPFIDEELSKIIYPDSIHTSIIEQTKININETNIEDFNVIQENVFQSIVQLGFKNYLNKNKDNSEFNDIIQQIKSKSEESNYQITLEKIIGNIFEKKSFRITTATRIEREDLDAVYMKQKTDPQYMDAISTDLMIKLKELCKFYEFMKKLDLNQQYRESYVFIQRCMFICQSIIFFRERQIKNIQNKDIQRFLNKCIKKLFNKKYNQNPDYLYANLFTFDNIFDEMNKQIQTNFDRRNVNTEVTNFIIQVYLSIIQNSLKQLNQQDYMERSKVMPKKKSNIFRQCIKFIEIMLKTDSSLIQNLQTKEFENLNSVLIKVLLILYQTKIIEKLVIQKYINVLIDYKINDNNCIQYLSILQDGGFNESMTQMLFQFNIPIKKVDLKKNLDNQQFKILLTKIITKSIEILKQEDIKEEQLIKVRKVYKILESYSIEVSKIFQDINQPYLYSLFVQNFANENFLKFFPQNSTNRKLSNIIKVIDKNSQRDQYATIQKLDFLIQKYQLLPNNQIFDFDMLARNLIEKSEYLNLSETLRVIEQLRLRFINEQNFQQKILHTLIEILLQKTTNMKNSQSIVKRLILNLNKIENLSQNLPQSDQLQKFIQQIKQLSLPYQLIQYKQQICHQQLNTIFFILKK